jgi:hypothetical protein
MHEWNVHGSVGFEPAILMVLASSASALAPILGCAYDLRVGLLGNLRLVYADFLVGGNHLR